VERVPPPRRPLKDAAAALAAVFLLQACASKAPVKTENSEDVLRTCAEATGVDYCIYQPRSESARDPSAVLYYLHGAGEDERSWGKWKTAKLFIREYLRAGKKVPTVISVSHGKLWILSQGGRGRAAKPLDAFIKEIMPAIEGSLGQVERRDLWGLSMGGFNAAQLLFKHPGLWRRAVLTCPAVTTLAPAASRGEYDAFIDRTGSEPRRVSWALERSRETFPDPILWALHDPIALAAAAETIPPLLVECGDQDEYGFHEGASRLVEAVRDTGLWAEFRSIKGGKHCASEPEAVLAFLLRESK